MRPTICTGLGYGRDFGSRQVRFAGPPVLAYLAPKYFTPDAQRLRRCGVNPDERLIFIRTVAWGASHDVGRKGSRPEEMRRMVERLSKFGRVLISSEGPLPDELAAWRNPVAVADIHHLLAFAAIALVEGGTMAAESAVLGTPAVCLQSYNFGYLVALEKQYGLIARAGSVAAALPIAEGLLELPDLRRAMGEEARPAAGGKRGCDGVSIADDSSSDTGASGQVEVEIICLTPNAQRRKE